MQFISAILSPCNRWDQVLQRKGWEQKQQKKLCENLCESEDRVNEALAISRGRCTPLAGRKIQTKIHIYTPVAYKNKVRSRHSWTEACGWWRDGDGCSEDTTIALKERRHQLCSQTYSNSLMIRRTKMAMFHLKIKQTQFFGCFLIDRTQNNYFLILT